jgi:hypothetical protein
MKNKETFNSVSQFAIPALTIASQLFISLKYPEYGLIISLIAQPFWLYSTWKSYKEAGQFGMFVATIVMTFIILAGIVNYWFL